MHVSRYLWTKYIKLKIIFQKTYSFPYSFLFSSFLLAWLGAVDGLVSVFLFSFPALFSVTWYYVYYMHAIRTSFELAFNLTLTCCLTDMSEWIRERVCVYVCVWEKSLVRTRTRRRRKKRYVFFQLKVNEDLNFCACSLLDVSSRHAKIFLQNRWSRNKNCNQKKTKEDWTNALSHSLVHSLLPTY